MELPRQPISPRPTSRLVTVTMELSNTRTDRGRRPRNRTETYVLGVQHGPGAGLPASPGDLFTFCCYRALLLGDPVVVVRAKAQPGGRMILTDPLPAQPLRGEAAVEARYWSNRNALLFRLQGQGGYVNRRFFGYRSSDGQGARPWLRYAPEEVILDRSTGAPPAFVDADDYQRKVRVMTPEGSPTKAQAWSTWFWLLLHKTFHAAKSSGHYILAPWDHQHGILFRGTTVTTHGC